MDALPRRKVGFAFDTFMLLHENHKRSHPERPARLMCIVSHLDKQEDDILESCIRVQCPFAQEVDIRRVHSTLELVERSRYNKKKLRDESVKVLKEHGTEVNYLEYDVFANRYSYECALMAVGASVEACNAIFKRKECQSVFAAIRPPGHHAEAAKVQGFCFFNNAAVAAKHLQ